MELARDEGRSDAVPLSVDARETAPSSRAGQLLRAARWTASVLLALFLFVGALQLMKTGAASLDLLRPGAFLVSNAASTLGLGWLGALLVLSGSPIAASATALVAASERNGEAVVRFTETQGFTMLTGSRLGAAFVVLVVAVVYALRYPRGMGHRKAPLSTAIACLSVTAIVYLPAAAIGLMLLEWESFGSLELTFPSQFSGIVDIVYGGMIARVEGLPSLVLFLGGLGVLLVSFKALDSVLPTFDEKTFVEGRRVHWLRSKWPMFAIGFAVALVTMSVSVALTVLVPLVAKKYVNRDHVIPYIMGANISTLGDTMLAAFALDSPGAVRVVLASTVSTTVLSVFLLAFLYPQLFGVVNWLQRVLLVSRPRLAAFTAALFVVPITTIAVAGLVA